MLKSPQNQMIRAAFERRMHTLTSPRRAKWWEVVVRRYRRILPTGPPEDIGKTRGKGARKSDKYSPLYLTQIPPKGAPPNCMYREQ